MKILRNKNILYPELSYKLNGIFFGIHNELGRFCSEKQYGDALDTKLRKANINYVREAPTPILFEGESKRRSIVDFIIENKIILELKVKTRLTHHDYYQMLRYLNAFKYELGFLINFRRQNLMFKRILNSKLYSGHSDSLAKF